MNITVYLGSAEGRDPLYARGARELGEWIGAGGHTLVYGGSRIGLMGILADAALDAGAPVIGVEPRFLVESCLQHEGITDLIVTETMQERKGKMLALGDAFIAFPGGTGTLEEISEAMSCVRLGLMKAPVIIYNLNGFYEPLRLLMDRMTLEGYLDPESREKIYFVSTVEELGDILNRRGGDGR